VKWFQHVEPPVSSTRAYSMAMTWPWSARGRMFAARLEFGVGRSRSFISTFDAATVAVRLGEELSIVGQQVSAKLVSVWLQTKSAWRAAAN